MDDRQLQLGPTGVAVAENVRRLREEQRLTYAELSRRLERFGRPIATLGLRRIENRQRRVDADDLTALAVALQVIPATLLMPPAGPDDDACEMTGLEGQHEGFVFWDWLMGRRGAEFGADLEEDGSLVDPLAEQQWEVRILPPYLRAGKAGRGSAMAAVTRLEHFVALAVGPITKTFAGRLSVEDYRAYIVTQLRRNTREINELADDLESGRMPPHED